MKPHRQVGMEGLGLEFPDQLRSDAMALVGRQDGQVDDSDFGIGEGNHEAADGSFLGENDPSFGGGEGEGMAGGLGTELLSDEHFADGAWEACVVEFALSCGAVEFGQKRLILRGFWPKRRMDQAHG